jgi:hypothetical protein
MYLKHSQDGEDFSHFVTLNTFGDEGPEDNPGGEIKKRDHTANVQLKEKRNEFK